MQQSTRLFINAAASYLRMGLTIGIGLVTVRLLFKYLGQDGYGLFTALVASGAFVGFISSSLTTSAQRHIAFALGQDDLAIKKTEYCSAQFLFMGIGLVVLVVGSLLYPVVLGILTIPEGYENEARLAFLLSIVNIALTTLVSPFYATIQAHQDIVFSSIMELIERVALLVLVLMIPFSPFDAIVTYAGCITGVTLLRGLMSVVFARWHYEEVSLIPRWVGWTKTKPLLSYAGITLASNIGITAQQQGALVMLNAFFGPAVNAAYSLAQQLSAYLVRLASALVAVMTPAAATKEGRGDTAGGNRYAGVGSRYPVYAAAMLAVPILLDTEMILKLWLGIDEAPPFGVVFVWMLVAMRMVGMMSWGDSIVAQAKGRIGMISLIQAGPAGLALLVAGLIYKYEIGGMGPLFLPIILLIAVGFAAVVFKPLWVGRMIDRPWLSYLKQVPGRAILATLPGLAVAVAIRMLLPEAWWRLVLIAVGFGLVFPPSVWWLGTEAWERQAWRGMGQKLMRRLGLGSTKTAEVG